MEDRWRRKHQDTLDELQVAQGHLSEARQRIDNLRSRDTALQLQVGGSDSGEQQRSQCKLSSREHRNK